MTRSPSADITRRAALTAIAGTAAIARAQPGHGTIELIVPYPAGGSLDTLARPLAQALATRLDSDGYVTNVGGASGALAIERFLQRPADGHALLLASLSQFMLKGHAGQTLRAQGLPIGKVGSTDYVIVCGPRFQARSLDDFVDAARAAPGRISLAHPGQETLQYLTARLLAQRAGIELLWVPYSGSAPMLSDLVTGEVDTALIALTGALPMVRSGRLRLLGVLRRDPHPRFPGLPVAGRSRSLPGFEAQAWAGLFVRDATAAERVARLRQALADVLRSRETQAALAALGTEPAEPEGDATAFAGFIRAELARYDVVQPEATAR